MGVLENIVNEKYDNKLPYPDSYEKTDSISQNERNKRAMTEARMAYRAETSRLERAVFKGDLEAEFGLLHYHHEKVWDIAWDEGHSEGLEAVYRWYERLADLFTVNRFSGPDQ